LLIALVGANIRQYGKRKLLVAAVLFEDESFTDIIAGNSTIDALSKIPGVNCVYCIRELL